MSYNSNSPLAGINNEALGGTLAGRYRFRQLLREQMRVPPRAFSFWELEMLNVPYVYELKDKETGKWYVGARTAKNCKPEDLGISYFTSSRVVSVLFKENPERFSKKILVVGDEEYVIKVESSVLKFRDARNDENSYNMHNSDGIFNPRKTGKIIAERNQKLGKAIFSQTKQQRIEAGRKGGLAAGYKNGKKQGKLNATNGVLIKARDAINRENLAELNGARFKNRTFEERSKLGKLASRKNWVCEVCGMAGNAGTISIHQKKSKHVGRVKNNVSA